MFRRFIRRFQNHRQACKRGIMRDPAHRRKTDESLADPRMAILSAAEIKQAVVEMQRAQTHKADGAVKCGKHALKIVSHIIPRRKHMARIQTDADLLRQPDTAEQLRHLLEHAADLRPAAGHGFDQNCRALIFGQHVVEQLRRESDSGINALTRVAAGMEIVNLMGECFHPREILRKAAVGEVPHLCIGGAGVERIRRVRDQRAEAVFAAKGEERLRIRGIDRFRVSAARITREELECVRANRERDAAGRSIPFCIAQVAAEIERFFFHNHPFRCAALRWRVRFAKMCV